MPKVPHHMRRKPRREGSILCRRYPIAYVNVPKSACTTIKNIMYFLDTGKHYPDPIAIHADKACLLKGVPQVMNEYTAAMKDFTFCFTFVREPFSRAYSAFNEKIFSTGKYSFPRFRSEVERRYGASFPAGEANYTKQEHAENFRCFLKFVRDNVAGKTELPGNPHWLPQSLILRRWRANRGIDLVGRVEKFEEGMSYVLAMAGYQGKVDLSVRYNEGPKPPFALSDVINSDIGSLLYEIYEPDIKEFRYG